MNKAYTHVCRLAIVAAIAAASGTSFAGHGAPEHGGHDRKDAPMHATSHSHQPHSRHDDFHDTYRKNLDKPHDRGPVHGNNIHAKISAAKAAAIRFRQKLEQASRSPISCYSNIPAPRPAAVAYNNDVNISQTINIYNSTVTIER